MLSSKEEFTATSVIRSMKRFGFPPGEIYDTLTGAGIQGGEVQLLMDRIEDDFEDAKIESRASRLGEEVEEIFQNKLRDVMVELRSELRSFKRDITSVSGKLDSLEDRVSELQGICTRGNLEKI